MLSILCTIVSLVASWMIYKKMGREGWEGIIPIYSTYVLCQELYGNGWKCLLMLIPLYNIYFGIKIYIDWAKAFGKNAGFAIGMLLLPFIFQLILAFGDAVYKDGVRANVKEDFVSQTVEKAKSVVADLGSKPDAAAELKKYKELLDMGAITEEEFEAKKKEILGL